MLGFPKRKAPVAQAASIPGFPVVAERGERRHTGEDRPTIPRPVVRCELFSGWGPKL
jgi:hypothetical protein